MLAASPALAQYKAPEHKTGFPSMVTGTTQEQATASLDLGPALERNRAARWSLAEHRRLNRALATLAPQRKGVVDAYVISIGLDSDPVFGREAREAGKVLARRFDASGRTLVLGGTNGAAPSELPNGSMANFEIALARVAEVMDPSEDVLVLYTTSHGAPVGIVYHDADDGFGILSPARLAGLLDELGIKNRVLILSACFSGVFVPKLESSTTALFTAASKDRTSFGCAADNDWTFFGDAMINHALRKPQPLAAAGTEAQGLITEWETRGSVRASNPQVSIGSKVGGWLAPLEARMPKAATEPVGRPAVEILGRLSH
ncbi:MAG: C13 family peptidase [Pseudomonadota bacterium]